MPSTLVGLLIFVISLAPGFVFLLALENRLPPRQLSTFRETISIAAVGLLCDFVALLVFSLAHQILPKFTPDVGELIRSPGPYWQQNYDLILRWSAGLFALACLIGLVLGRVWNSSALSETSGWWSLFETAYVQAKKLGAVSLVVYCELTDKSLVAGPIRSWSLNGRDGPDRDLVLQAPIYRRTGEVVAASQGMTEAHLLVDLAVMAITARQIVHVSVEFLLYDIADVKSYPPEPTRPVPVSPVVFVQASEAAEESRPSGDTDIRGWRRWLGWRKN